MKNRIVRALLFISALAPALVAGQGASPLPFDPKFTVGTLPNGLHYYIRKNAQPAKRAELRLVVNAGSILEDNDQLGYAHFIEHMAFNGTTHFPKNALVNYLQSIGLRFGADLNAGTSFDETIYNLTVPTDTARLVDTGVEVLAEWAHEQLFDSTEVVNERGVVREEWRLGRGAGQRMSDKEIPIILKGSKYADRLPIGNEKSIMSAQPSVLKRFYQKWYRPDLMAVVAVGDFDPAEIETMIKKYFDPIPAVQNPTPRPAATVPANKDPLIAIATDKEATSSVVQVGFKRTYEPLKTTDDYRRSLVEQIYRSMLNARLVEVAQKPNAPFNSAGISLSGFFARGLDAFTIGANVKNGGMQQGLEAVLVEIRRADELGFLASELDRAKAVVLRGAERAYTERATQTHAAYVNQCISAFLNGTTPVAPDFTYPLLQQMLPTITLAEVNGLAAKWITPENRVILAQGPDKEGVQIPSAGDLKSTFGKADKAKLTAYTESVPLGSLIEKEPAPGRIVSERQIPDVNATEWKLSNGIKVYVKTTDFKADEVLFAGSRDGGTSTVGDETYVSASQATAIMSMSGAGKFSAQDLDKKIRGSGKVASAGLAIGPYSESISGAASVRDLETALQLLYLRVTEPRVDKPVWTAYKERLLAALANAGASPEAAFRDTITATMGRHAYRARPLSARVVDEMDPDLALSFYKDRVADLGDFTLAFVGNIEPDALRPLVEKYIASLPAHGAISQFRDVSTDPPSGVVEKAVRKGTEPRATTQFYFTGPFQYTPDNRFAFSALMAVLQIRVTETLREQLGGTYSPSAGGGTSHIPQDRYTISIGYPSAPANVDKLEKSVFAIIDTLQTRGPSQADIDKVREQIIRGRENSAKQNGYWVGVLISRDESPDDYTKLMAASDERLKNLSVALVQEAARKYLDPKNHVKFVLVPEK